MTEDERLRLWAVEEVGELTPEITVVRNVYTGRLLLKRRSSPEALDTLRKVSQLHNENLMEIYDVRLIGEACVSLCEYVAGVTLEDALRDRGVFSEQEAVRVIVSVCRGLKSLHEAGIVHRDVNPSNVMLDSTGCVKVIDYDIARVRKPDKRQDTTIMGTVGYVAPEQFGFQQTDKRADVFSCGVLLNVLLTGRLPHEQLYPGALGAVISRCIRLEPQERYANTEHLLAALTNDRKYFKLIEDSDYESIRIRPIPGFRSGRFLPKLLTVIGAFVYCFALLIHILTFVEAWKQRGWPAQYYANHAFLVLIVYGCWTLFPYLLFGDVGRYSARISRDLRIRKRIRRAFGWGSIALGFVLLILYSALYHYGLLTW